MLMSATSERAEYQCRLELIGNGARVWLLASGVERRVQRAVGFGHIKFMLGDEDPPALVPGNFHHLGATRMHTHLTMAVDDADCRVHGVHNLYILYIARSWVFRTHGCSKPTLTIVALAQRLADRLKKLLAA
jgi:choline dehydrogenase-like flavoprotein